MGVKLQTLATPICRGPEGQSLVRILTEATSRFSAAQLFKNSAWIEAHGRSDRAYH